jgi:hypothetical protein
MLLYSGHRVHANLTGSTFPDSILQDPFMTLPRTMLKLFAFVL